MSENRRPMNRPLLRTLLASSLGLTVLSGCGDEPPRTCLSPATESSIYPGDPNADPDFFPSWKTGVLITTTLHPEATGLVVSYGRPNTSYWADTSQVIVPSRAQKVALRIGEGDVVMATQTVAEMGSVACHKPPDSFFSQPQEFGQLLAQNATLPAWDPPQGK